MPYHRIFLFLFWTLVQLIQWLGPIEVRAETQVIQLPAQCHDVAYREDNGDVLLVNSDDAKLFLIRSPYFSGDKLALSEISIPDKPKSAVYKKINDKHYFVISSIGKEIYLVDADTLALSRTYEVRTNGATTLHTSRDPLDPFLCFNGHGHDRSNLGGYLNLKTAQLSNYLNSAAYSTISADGGYFYPISSGSTTGFEVQKRSMEREHLHFRDYYVERDSKGLPLPDTRNLYAAADNTVYSADLSRVIGELNGHIVAFSDHHPIVVTFDTMQRIGLWRHHDLTLIGRQRLPEELKLNDFYKKRYFIHRHFIVDDNADRLLIFNGDKVAVMPLSDLGYKKTPWLIGELTSDTFFADQASQARINLITPSSQVSLISGPEGLSIENGHILWKPSQDQVGMHRLNTRISMGDASREQQFKLTVTQPYLTLPFTANNFNVSADRRYLIAWFKGSDTSGQHARLALIDLKTEKLISEKSAPVVIRDAAVDAHGVYVQYYKARTDLGRKIFKLNHSDLAQVGVLHTKDYHGSLSSLKDGLLVNGATIIDTTNMTVRQSIKGIDRPTVIRGNPYDPRDFRWFIGPWVMDRHAERFESILDEPVTWTTRLEKRMVLKGNGDVLFNDRNDRIIACKYLESHPLLAAYRAHRSRQSEEVLHTVTYYNLHDGNPAGVIKITRSELFSQPNLTSVYPGDEMFIPIGNRLYRILPDQEIIAKSKMPFMLYTDGMPHLSHKDELQTISIKATQSVKSYQMPVDIQGVRLDQTNGELEIDPGRLRAPTSLFGSKSKSDARRNYEQAFGKPPKGGDPVIHTISVRATNESGDVAQADIPVLALGQKQFRAPTLSPKSSPKRREYRKKWTLAEKVNFIFTSIVLVTAIIVIISSWRIFEKAGQPGWASIIPLYNIVVLLKIIEKPDWAIPLFIPLVNIIFEFAVAIELSKRFGKGEFFGVGMVFLPMIFVPILAFGRAEYSSAQKDNQVAG